MIVVKGSSSLPFAHPTKEGGVVVGSSFTIIGARDEWDLEKLESVERPVSVTFSAAPGELKDLAEALLRAAVEAELFAYRVTVRGADEPGAVGEYQPVCAANPSSSLKGA